MFSAFHAQIAALRARTIDPKTAPRIRQLRIRAQELKTALTAMVAKAMAYDGADPAVGLAQVRELSAARTASDAADKQLNSARHRVFSTVDATLPEIAAMADQRGDAASALVRLMADMDRHVTTVAARHQIKLIGRTGIDEAARGLKGVAALLTPLPSRRQA
jgi:hypothetical protein